MMALAGRLSSGVVVEKRAHLLDCSSSGHQKWFAWSARPPGFLYAGILSSRRQPNYVFDDIENSISPPINEDDISFENDSLPIVG